MQSMASVSIHNTTETDHGSSSSSNSLTRILMFPWLAYSHISAFLKLAKKLANRGLYTYICSTPINLISISNKIPEKYSQYIELVEFHPPNMPEFPPHYHTTNALPRHLLPTLFMALKLSEPELHKIIKSRINPDLVIYDAILLAKGITLLHNIPSIQFATFSALTLSYVSHMILKPDIEYPFRTIYLKDFELAKLINATRGLSCGLSDNNISNNAAPRELPMLVNTCRKLEAKYLDHFGSITKREIFPVGPLIQEPVVDRQDDKEEDIELFKWLNQKTAFSTILVSFGSECVLTDEETKEIALALELSNKVNFIWVLRFPKGKELVIKVEEILPQGFLERVKDRGRIVQGWAPQGMILRHPSIVGFVSHCGWNTVLECIEFGVPIIAIPMHFEQALNARWMVDNGIAVEVMKDDENEKFKGEEIAELIRDVVIGNAGNSMRQKIKELSKNMKSSEKEDLDGVVRMLALLSEKDSYYEASGSIATT
ncbi:hypothetical protein ACH5RR_019001 [Cinchona calisaya]|uniref:Glycosyltransferase N-terminal domain-containing protein n=1 Tax=Cinchona calisaya TaxID=153742 RepID=A0ABD2ZQX0_9GENT